MTKTENDKEYEAGVHEGQRAIKIGLPIVDQILDLFEDHDSPRYKGYQYGLTHPASEKKSAEKEEVELFNPFKTGNPKEEAKRKEEKEEEEVQENEEETSEPPSTSSDSSASSSSSSSYDYDYDYGGSSSSSPTTSAPREMGLKELVIIGAMALGAMGVINYYNAFFPRRPLTEQEIVMAISSTDNKSLSHPYSLTEKDMALLSNPTTRDSLERKLEKINKEFSDRVSSSEIKEIRKNTSESGGYVIEIMTTSSSKTTDSLSLELPADIEDSDARVTNVDYMTNILQTKEGQDILREIAYKKSSNERYEKDEQILREFLIGRINRDSRVAQILYNKNQEIEEGSLSAQKTDSLNPAPQPPQVEYTSVALEKIVDDSFVTVDTSPNREEVYEKEMEVVSNIPIVTRTPNLESNLQAELLYGNATQKELEKFPQIAQRIKERKMYSRRELESISDDELHVVNKTPLSYVFLREVSDEELNEYTKAGFVPLPEDK